MQARQQLQPNPMWNNETEVYRFIELLCSEFTFREIKMGGMGYGVNVTENKLHIHAVPDDSFIISVLPDIGSYLIKQIIVTAISRGVICLTKLSLRA